MTKEKQEFWSWIKLKLQIVQLLIDEKQEGFEVEVEKRLNESSGLVDGHCSKG